MSAHASVAPRAEGGKPAAEAKGATSAQVALAWLLAFDNLVFTLVFTESMCGQLARESLSRCIFS